jgi:hypothetical protein
VGGSPQTIGTVVQIPDDLVRDVETNLQWQWENMQDVVLSSLYVMTSGDPGGGLGALKQRQGHNPLVADRYQKLYDMNAESFWTAVVSAANIAGNVPEARLNIDWQAGNNHDSLVNAQSFYLSDVRFHEAIAMFWLLSGQRHNPHVMEIYRATFRDAANSLWDYVISKL